MMQIRWSELFPGQKSFLIFVLYITLFVNQGILVTWSQRNGGYEYNIVIVVLFTEVLKLIISACLYCREKPVCSLFHEMNKHKKVLLLYMVPSSFYCLYNNLSFVNLATFDPPTYFLLLQFRVVITGIIFQLVFKKQLSTKQWISLIILTIGCIVKHLNLDGPSNPKLKTYLDIKIFLIFLQTICSCLAGVYNEYLLKKDGVDVNIFVQNVFMYLDSIVCNVAVLLAQGNLIESISKAGPSIFANVKVLMIILNNAAVGIITSFFLKNLNSIVKTFASALELVFSAILCWLFFDIPIHLNTAIAIGIVSYAVILYSQNPVQNVQIKNYDLHDDDDQNSLLKFTKRELQIP